MGIPSSLHPNRIKRDRKRNGIILLSISKSTTFHYINFVYAI
tara:strand:+ start:386 stop:511 length:126 start_codon:yes stop_codon:yes gene_type:complete